MNISRFVNPISVTIAGLVIIIGGTVLIYSLLIKNAVDALNAQTLIYSTNVQYEGAPQIAAAKKSVVDAQTQVNVTQSKWNQILFTRNPDIDFSNRITAWNQYIDELNFNLAPAVEQWLPSTGIRPLDPITTPAPPTDPNAVVAKSPIVIPLDGGNALSVLGTFPQIMNHVERWNNFKRIVLINALDVDGISPYLVGSYTATVYIFPRNDTTPGPAVPSGGK